MKKKIKVRTDEATRTAAAPPPPQTAGMAQRFLKSPFLHLLLIVVVALAAYANSFHGEFVFDDLLSIVDNPAIKNLSAFLSGAGYAYNPRRFIGYLSFALNYRLGGLDVVGYHAVNLAIHIVTAWLVYWLVRLTLRTPFFQEQFQVSSFKFQVDGPKTLNLKLETLNLVPLIAALLFVAHPVQTQAVTYIVQRLTSLATLFYLLSLVLYIKGRLAFGGYGEESTNNSKFKTQNLKSFFLFAFALISALLAMRTKEIAFTFPLVATLYEFSFFGGSNRKKLLFLIPLLLLLLAIPLGMLHAGKPIGELLSDVSEQTRVQTNIPRLHYLFTQFSVIVTYIRLLFFPVNQNLDYDYPIYDSLFTPQVLISFLLLLALLGLAVYLFFRSRQNSKLKTQNPPSGALRLIAFGILWYFITLSVESSIIPIVDVIFEHRLYLPSVGIFMAVSAATALLAERVGLRVLTASAAVVVLALAAATWQRNLVWRDSLVLWRDVIDKSPGKGRAHNELGRALFERNRTDEAIEQYRRALSLDPALAFVHVNLGAAYHRKGELDQAIQEYNVALSMKTNYAELHNNLGTAYCEKGVLDKAAEEYQMVLQQQPDNAKAHINLGIIHHKKGELDQAIMEYQTALRYNPNSATIHNDMGRAYVQALQLDKAVEQFNAAIALDPTDTDSKNRLDKLLAVMDMMKKDRTARP